MTTRPITSAYLLLCALCACTAAGEPAEVGTAGLAEGREPPLQESHDVDPPAGYVRPRLEGATFPLQEDDPRATLELGGGLVIEDALSVLKEPVSGGEQGRVGSEKRQLVEDTRLHPYSATTLLLSHFPGSPRAAYQLCSGTMLSHDAVLTSARCVFNPVAQQWADGVVVVPGAQPGAPGRIKAPYGSAAARKLFAHDHFRSGVGLKQAGHDVGVVRLKNALPGATTRVLASGVAPVGLDVVGYHREPLSAQMYFSPGKHTGWLSSEHGVFNTDADTHVGCSGSGVTLPKELIRIFGIMRGCGRQQAAGIWFDDALVKKVYGWVHASP